MKRISSENGDVDMAKCLVLLSTRFELKISKRQSSYAFECKTCHREFPSFQALGGHRASHKRPRVMLDEKNSAKFLSLVMKPKMHKCSICGLEFAMGQALGGHMRRHRAVLMEESLPEFRVVSDADHRKHREEVVVPVLRRTNSSSRRVFGMDLNLTPLENDLVVLFGKMAPKVDAFV